MKDVLRQCDGLEDQVYIVHLVCASQKLSTNRKAPEQITENVSISATIRNTTEHTRLNNINCVQNQGQNNNSVITQHTPPQMYSTQQYLDPRNNQQMAWMQQAYTHYFTQYMQL